MKKLGLSVFGAVLFTASIGYGAAILRQENVDHTHEGFGIEELSHGGGLDQCGGHWNRKLGTYHYHRKRC